mmetsp:Transcript_20427/g.40505  ORF Transcript_20427/g.40505 Transcript_20427/m.40505 type:complete len:216 (-) Transcript_20427:443-1090(-)
MKYRHQLCVIVLVWGYQYLEESKHFGHCHIEFRNHYAPNIRFSRSTSSSDAIAGVSLSSSSSSSPSSPPNRSSSSSSSSLIEEVLRTGLFALPAGGGILMLLFLRRLAGPESPRFALGCSSSSSRPKRSSTPRAFSSAFRSSSAFSDASSPNSSLRVDRLLKMSWSLSACPSTSMNSSRKSSSVSIALVTRTFSFFLLRLEPLMILRTASGVRAT